MKGAHVGWAAASRPAGPRTRTLSARAIRPLGIFFWGATATLGAWCELREDFRNFRIDRIEDRADVVNSLGKANSLKRIESSEFDRDQF